jgi:hypothetical protein
MKAVKKTGARWFRTLSPARSPRADTSSSLGLQQDDGGSTKSPESSTAKSSWRTHAPYRNESSVGSHAERTAAGTTFQSIADSCKRQAAADSVNINAVIGTLTQLRSFNFNGDEKLSQVRERRLCWTRSAGGRRRYCVRGWIVP